ncbi:hypothetical protein D6T63_15965 [Arthrobacter cheniae]|uniref:Uncharacterized protein n=1 Tax=Arthrobacter cheniae TaxID=1258888 RepID=A0A3A5M2P7_9MICC|nr:hypothetical protein [Arthrobacter cheniae]RJT76953.1 hypothetical protein D6T63_15965 [Arthrobacter cheniae]
MQSLKRDTPTSYPQPTSARRMLMSMEKPPRRPRGTRAETVQVAYYIAPEAKRVLVELSDKLGVSAGAGLEKILLNLELDERGLPVWADHDNIQEVLPMARAS